MFVCTLPLFVFQQRLFLILILSGGGEDDGMIYLDEVKLDTPPSQQVQLDVPVGVGEGRTD